MKGFLVLRCAALIVFSMGAFAQRPHVAKELQHVDPNSSVDVIVQFKQSPTAQHHQKIVNLGGRFKRGFRHIQAESYSLPASNLAALAADPDVTYISLDRKVHMLLDNTAAAVNAPVAWSLGFDGSGIGIALIDSGISEHDDLQGTNGSRIVYRQSFVNSDTNDDFGHGEHVAGILAGNGTDSNCPICTRNLIGIAPNANLIDLQALDGTGTGSDSTVIAAIDEAIDLQQQFNIRVINLSLGRPIYESYTQDPLCQAVEAAWSAGIVVVVAAGNDGRDDSANNNGYGTIMAPGNDPYVITVGAMKTMGTPDRSDDLIASYSSKGPTAIDNIVKPDLVAPGNQVVSLLSPTGSLQSLYPQNLIPLNYYEATSDTTPSTSYFMLSGTSMATPVVSGAAALLLQANPQLNPDQVKAKLMLTAYKNFPSTSTAVDPVTGQSFTSQYDIFTVGAGYLNIQAALSDNNHFFGSALSPRAVFTGQTNSAGQTLIVCTGNSICAGQRLWGPWSLQSIWGSQVITSNQYISGNQSLWGDQSIWSDQSIWGDLVAPTNAELNTIAIQGEP